MYQAAEAVITSYCNLLIVFDTDAPLIVDGRMLRNAVLKFQVVDLFFLTELRLLFSNLIDINKSYNVSAAATFYCCHPTGINATAMDAVSITNPLICGDDTQETHALLWDQQVPYSLKKVL
jgi:hypothetical protein